MAFSGVVDRFIISQSREIYSGFCVYQKLLTSVNYMLSYSKDKTWRFSETILNEYRLPLSTKIGKFSGFAPHCFQRNFKEVAQHSSTEACYIVSKSYENVG